MTEFAPAAVHHIYDRLCELRPAIPWALGGILGDQAHTYGYHRARAALPVDDYSVILKRDQGGPEWAAAAIDITAPDQEHHRRLSRRLHRATSLGDQRLYRSVREWYGSLDGETVAGYDLATRQPSSSDDSHLWHVHISLYRDTVMRPQLLGLVADVLAGR